MFCFQCRIAANGAAQTCPECGEPFVTDSDIYFRAGMESMASRDFDMCITLLQDCVILNPNHLEARYNLLLALCSAYRVEEALAQYKLVSNAEPVNQG